MNKFLGFLESKYLLTSFSLITIFFFSAFFVAHGKFWEGLKFSGLALTSDEVSHIPAGYYYLKTQKYFINAEHPPLIKDISGFPLLFLNPRLPSIPEHLKYENIQWEFGGNFLFKTGNDPDKIAFLSRNSVLLLNTLLLVLTFILVKKLLGKIVAILSLLLFVFSPNVVAHSPLVAFDVPLSFFVILSILSFSLFLKKFVENSSYVPYFICSIIFTSLALLTKFQALFLIFSIFSGGAIFIFFKERKKLFKYLTYLIYFSLCTILIVGFWCGLHTLNMGIEGLAHQIGYSYPSEWPKIGKEILIKIVSLNCFLLNGIVEYLVGVMMMVSRVKGAWQATYFMGNVYGSEGAGILYFPILFLTKETLGFLIALSIVVIFTLVRFFKGRSTFKQKLVECFQNPFFAVSFMFISVYLIFSLSMRLNIGIRHIFPVTFLLYILVPNGIKNLNRRLISLFLILLCFHFLSFVITYPYFLSYYNILGGGKWNGYKIATDSNYDWGGQDVKRLAKWIKENKIEKIYGHIFSNVDLKYYLGEGYEYFNIRFQNLPPKGSLIVVSAFELQNVNYDKGLPPERKYFQLEKNLIKRIGTTMFVFRVD